MRKEEKMAHVLELSDGSLITPIGLFDALDVVEEYMGTEMRQYLEEWFDEGQEELTEDERFEELREHYRTVLMNISDEVDRMLTRKQKMRDGLQKIKNMIRREEHEED